MKSRTAVLLLTCVLVGGAGCKTNVNAYPIENGKQGRGGIPFFLPKPVAHIRAPIEVARRETLFALIEVGGLHQFLYELDPQDWSNALSSLKAMLGLPPAAVVQAVPMPTTVTALSEVHKQDAANKLETTKYHLIPAPAALEGKSTPFYSTDDSSKSVEILYLPDEKRRYELVVTGETFSTLETNITIEDGWRLAAVGAKSGENQALATLSSALTTALGAQKEVKVAEIAREQALELARLAQPDAEDATPDAGVVPPAGKAKEVSYRVVGYVKRVSLEAIQPGLYEVSAIFNRAYPRVASEHWIRVSF